MSGMVCDVVWYGSGVGAFEGDVRMSFVLVGVVSEGDEPRPAILITIT